MPTASNSMDEEARLEELPTGNSDMRISTLGTTQIYIGTLDRPRKDKRQGDRDKMDEGINKDPQVQFGYWGGMM